jgi:hypothetical protein
MAPLPKHRRLAASDERKGRKTDSRRYSKGGIMKRAFSAWVSTAAGLQLLTFPAGSSSAPRLDGAWSVASIRFVSKAGTSEIRPAQGGLFLFTGRHYSIAWHPSELPRGPSATRWFPTDEEKAADFNTVIFNSGTYEADDTVFTTFPEVAKTPEFTGGTGTYRYRAAGDTLWITALEYRSFDGVIDPGANQVVTTWKLVRAR